MTCGSYPKPYAHVFDGGNNHPYNSYVYLPWGNLGPTFPEGHTCMCGALKYHQMTLEESFAMLKVNSGG